MMTTVSGPLPMQLHCLATALITSLHRVGKDLQEGKTVLQVIMEGYLEVNYVDISLMWNTDLVETMKLENLISKTAQGLYSGEARATNHEDFPERDDVQ